MDYNVSLDTGTILIKDIDGIGVNSDNLIVLGNEDYFIPINRVKEIRAVNLTYDSESNLTYKVNVGRGQIITLTNMAYHSYNAKMYSFEDETGVTVYVVNENYINSFTIE